MASFNKVYLIGNLTRDPELKYTPSGVAVVNLRLAVNRRFKDKSGENKEEVCFVTVVAWDRQAEVCNQYLKKGRMVFIEGRLQSRSWETADGQKRNVLDIRAEMVQFLSPAKAGETVASGASGASAEMPTGGDITEETRPQIPKVENVSWDEEEKSE